MKKICVISLSIILLFSFPVTVSAETQKDTIIKNETQIDTLITSGYTDEGFYYTAYDALYVINSDNSISVSKRLIYDGNITPPIQISWQERINGVSYSGILYLASYTYKPSTGTTTAEYYGTLTAD